MQAYQSQEMLQQAADEVDVKQILTSMGEGRDEQIAQNSAVQLQPRFPLKHPLAIRGAIQHVGSTQHSEEEPTRDGFNLLGQ